MSFIINLYNNESDNIFLDKTLNFLGYLSFNTFRTDYDVFSPTITVQTNDETTVLDSNNAFYSNFASDVLSGKINYMSIPSTNIFYFVTEKSFIQDNVLEIQLREDVLSTRKALIRLSEGIIRRNENLYNLYIPDGQIHTYANPIVRRKTFSNGTGSFDVDTPANVILCAGAGGGNVNFHPFNITINRFGNPLAKNGGACIYIPWCAFPEVGLRNPNWNDFRAKIKEGEPILYNAFLIAPLAAYYGPYYESDGKVYLDEGFCIARIKTFRVDQYGSYTCLLEPVKSYSYGTTLTLQSSTDLTMNKDFYMWSIGGEYDQALQGSGASAVVNGVVFPPNTSVNYATPVSVAVNSTVDLKFYSRW